MRFRVGRLRRNGVFGFGDLRSGRDMEFAGFKVLGFGDLMFERFKVLGFGDFGVWDLEIYR